LDHLQSLCILENKELIYSTADNNKFELAMVIMMECNNDYKITMITAKHWFC